MKTTLSWLKSHLETDASATQLTERLIMLGHDVEGIEDRAAALAGYVVARVVSAERHPNADRLQVCVVDAGAGEVQVVCGAPNARTGMIGVFGRAGVRIPKTGAVLTESAIRGVQSRGMLMSAYELALSDDHEGIIELPQDAPLGTPYAGLLGLQPAVARDLLQLRLQSLARLRLAAPGRLAEFRAANGVRHPPKREQCQRDRHHPVVRPPGAASEV